MLAPPMTLRLTADTTTSSLWINGVNPCGGGIGEALYAFQGWRRQEGEDVGDDPWTVPVPVVEVLRAYLAKVALCGASWAKLQLHGAASLPEGAPPAGSVPHGRNQLNRRALKTASARSFRGLS